MQLNVSRSSIQVLNDVVEINKWNVETTVRHKFY